MMTRKRLNLIKYNYIIQVKAQSYRKAYVLQVEQGTINFKIQTISQIRRQVFFYIDLDIFWYVTFFLD